MIRGRTGPGAWAGWPAAVPRGILLAAVVAACGAEAPGGVPGGGATPSAPSTPPAASPSPGRVPGLEGAGLPTLLPEAVLDRVPTRVRAPDLGIDLAVVSPRRTPNSFPPCGVAEFLPTLSRPGRPGATFIYAHARPGMFLPILEAAKVDRGRGLIGLRVQVFTSDDRRFSYEVTDVMRHVESLDFAYRTLAEQLLLQTSEGPVGTSGKTIVVAEPRSEEASAPAESRPRAQPVRCD